MLKQKIIPITNKLFEKNATIYEDSDVNPKANILYFHGGGLLYGHREDLPNLHLETLTSSGYRIIAFDYPLAPAAKLDLIMDDVLSSINDYLEHPEQYESEALPYFLWGRSAGAYLCLLAAASGKCKRPPKGVLSYYGYGFLCDGWFMTPSKYYCTFPPVSDTALSAIPSGIHASGGLDTHYSVYVYARQKGSWIDLIYAGRQKYFYLDYTLRTCDKMPCPLFCAHSIGDTDVPYSEFLELCNHYPAKRFIATSNTHDFDRDETNPVTVQLLNATIEFMEQKMEI
ncbi:alpha/beta hydrolase [Faecalicatena contorta]|uniref:alpha/beta hydrolase n=1 Tax=Faecalicatena contorta TaxID=39482 RepID=UPI001F1D6642|nr:alpha/beta hydrolase [Faecalicatena contorta]MCF2555312.1 alpha/beta hydrolase [Faecalicatena contorta]